VSRTVRLPGCLENAVYRRVDLVAPVLLIKQVKDAIQVLRTITLLEKDPTLRTRAGTKRHHDALCQSGKTGKAGGPRYAGAAEEDDVASIALLQKFDWDTRTNRQKTHSTSASRAHPNNPMRVKPPFRNESLDIHDSSA
jgi:hypothetical protein